MVGDPLMARSAPKASWHVTALAWFAGGVFAFLFFMLIRLA